jgi:hypothetical protein
VTRRESASSDTLPDHFRYGLVDRAGVGLLFRDAELWKHLENFV